MTINQIVNRYLEHLSGGKSSYSLNSAAPILPFLLSDVMYQEYTKKVSVVRFKQRMRVMDKTWRGAYHQFIMSLLNAFRRDEWDDIGELMDGLGDSVANDVVMLRSRIMLVMDDVSLEDKQIVASLLVCHIFAQYAQHAWGDIYKSETRHAGGRVTRPNKNRHLEVMKDVSFKMACEYFKPLSNGSIRLSELDADGYFRAIAKHIYDWIDEQNSPNRVRVDE